MTPQDLVFVGDESFRKIKIAEHQEEFQTLPAVRSSDGNAIIVRYKLSPNELDRLNEGSDLFLTVLTMGKPLQPIMPFVDDAKHPTTARDMCENWRQFIG
jgi:hypothetical protein